MKKITHVSDITGKDIVDHVQISIKRKDHGIAIGKNTYYGDTVLDVDASELGEVLKSITFKKNQVDALMMSHNTPEMALAEFHKPGASDSSGSDKVRVVSNGEALEPSGYVETP